MVDALSLGSAEAFRGKQIQDAKRRLRHGASSVEALALIGSTRKRRADSSTTPITQIATWRARRRSAAERPRAAGTPISVLALATAASAAPSWPGMKNTEKLTSTNTALMKAASAGEMRAPTA